MNLPELLSELASGSGDYATARAVAAYGAEALPLMGPVFTDGWPGPIAPITCLRMIAREGHVDAFAELARAEPAATLAVLESLGHGQRAAAVPLLAEFAADQVYWVDAVRALAAHGGDAARDALVASWSARVGDDIDDAVASESASDSTLDLEGWIELAAALARVGDNRGLQLITTLASYGRGEGDAEDVRTAAAAALAWLPSPEASEALRAALEDEEEEEVLEAAVTSLGSYGLAAAIPLLLSRAAQDDSSVDIIVAAMRDIVGSEGFPQDTSAPALRRWWMRASQHVDLRAVQWDGQPANPAVAMARFADRRRADVARHAVARWTGIDFVDAAQEMPGDDLDVARAQAWWAAHEADWVVGGLYRAGRRLDVAPILAALANRSP
jgi:hypothetical protein